MSSSSGFSVVIKRLREAPLAFLFLAPSFAIFGLFFYYPFVRILGWGTYRAVDRGANYEPAGLDVYRDVIGSSDFRGGLWVTIQYVLISVPVGLILGVSLAMLAHRRLRGIKIFQTIFTSTIATSVPVAAVIFYVLINPTFGFWRVDLLADPDKALPTVALVGAWKNLSLAFVIVLAGLQAIPEELLEAAEVDGYGPLKRFFRVTVPLLTPVLGFLVVVLSVGAMQEYALVDILTSGGPAGRTETMVLRMFENQLPYNITRGAVLSVGLFAATLAVSGLQFFLLERRMEATR